MFPAAEWEVWFYQIPEVICKELYKRTSAPHPLSARRRASSQENLADNYLCSTLRRFPDMLWLATKMGCYLPLQGRCSTGQNHDHAPNRSTARGSVPWQVQPLCPSYSQVTLNGRWSSPRIAKVKSEILKLSSQRKRMMHWGPLAKYDS